MYDVLHVSRLLCCCTSWPLKKIAPRRHYRLVWRINCSAILNPRVKNEWQLQCAPDDNLISHHRFRSLRLASLYSSFAGLGWHIKPKPFIGAFNSLFSTVRFAIHYAVHAGRLLRSLMDIIVFNYFIIRYCDFYFGVFRQKIDNNDKRRKSERATTS